MRKIGFLMIILVQISLLNTAVTKIDSHESALIIAKEKEKVELLNKDLDKAKQSVEKSSELSGELGYQKGGALSYSDIGSDKNIPETEKKEKEVEKYRTENEQQKLRLEKENLIDHLYFYGLMTSITILILITYLYHLKQRLNKKLASEVDERTKRLYVSEQKYRDLFEQANDGIIILQDEKLKVFNKRFIDMVEYDPDDIFKGKFIDFVSEDNRKDFLQRQQNRLSRRKPRTREEICLCTINNKKIDVELSIKLIEYEGVIGELIMLRDITQRKAVHKKLIYSERVAGIGEIAGGIAHEIKNPLSNINSSIQLLKSEFNFEKEVNVYLDIIERNVGSANTVVQKLIDFAKPRDVNLELKDIKQILDYSLKLLKSRIRKSNTCIIQTEFYNLPKIQLDEVQLHSVFTNIILNSIQSFEIGGTLNISATVDDEHFHDNSSSHKHVRLSFKDNGTGIPKEIIDKIFDPFFTTKKDGSGHGLSLVFQIITEHKGTVEVFSEEGKGTDVVLRFPIPDPT